MEIRRLRYFLALAEAGNFTRAAERSFVAQSALSAQIARLEAEVGSQLFVRARSGVRLTAAGEALRPMAVRILGDVALAEEEMAAIRGLLIGRLRIGMIQGLPASVDLLGLIASFRRDHDGVDLEVRTGASLDLAEQVAGGDLDLAIVGLPAAEVPVAVRYLAIVDDPLVGVFAVTGRRARRQNIGVSELVDRGPFIHYRRRSGLRVSVEAALARAGVEPGAPFELDQISDMVRLASLGVGVTIVPASAAVTPVAPGHEPFAVATLTDRQAVHHIGVITPDVPSRPSVAFLEKLSTP